MSVRTEPAGFPRFRAHLRPEFGDAGVFLFGEHGVTALDGPHVVALARLLDGTRCVEAVLRARPAGLDPDQVSDLLRRLAEAGLVTFAAPAGAAGQLPALAWWDACGVDPGHARGPGRVGLTVLGGDAAPVRAAMAAAGLAVVEASAVPDLDVVLCSDYLDPALAAVDDAHRGTGRPWLPAKTDGARVWLGPVFGPPDVGCWHCLAHRLWAHRQAEAVVQRGLGRTGPAPRPAASLPSVTVAAANLVALEASKWVAGHRYAGQACVWVFDTHELTGERHQLRARPQCPSCGDPGLVAATTRRPVRLRPALKCTGGGGGDRTQTPEQVLDTHRHLISPVTGIVKQVTRDPRAPAFAHAYRSGANLSRQLSGLPALRHGLRAENGGKGLTSLDAEVGALCEAVERFSGTWQGDEHRVRGSLNSLGEQAVDPRACLLFDDRQYASRESWNPRHSPFNHVPTLFDPAAELDWTPLWSLSGGRHRMLPTAMLYYGGPTAPSMLADSNGCAAGAGLEDAILQGALELVERDAVALWWYNRLRVPEVDLAAFGDPRFDELRGHHAGIGRDLHVLDVTSDLGIPTMVAVSRRTGGSGERILLGFGAHLDPDTALRRAVTEVNQMLPADAVDARSIDDPDSARWLAHATLDSEPYLRPDPAVPARGPGDFGYVRRADIRDDVEALVATFAEHGLETLVLDQTRPDVGLSVVKVVVPGLRSFWARYAAGRLFDAPMQQGRLAGPTPYGGLNPQPLFM